MLKIVIAGAAGKMGLAIIKEANQSNDTIIVGALEHCESPLLGQDAGELAGIDKSGVTVSAEIDNLVFDMMIDFSSPAAVLEHLEICIARESAIVLGTTGLNEAQNRKVSDAAKQIPVLTAANTSVGVNLCAALVELASKVVGNDTDIEIVEAHHKHKVDAPSGTALLLGEAAASALDRDLHDCGVFSREGQTGERVPGTIGFSAIRGGDIAGEHTVLFIGNSERIEITHRVMDRRIFAQGALRAARWLAGQAGGLYNMQDVLDLH